MFAFRMMALAGKHLAEVLDVLLALLLGALLLHLEGGVVGGNQRVVARLGVVVVAQHRLEELEVRREGP